ncbi:MAG: YicC family protein [Acidobacteria bacterium]|nr:YicC family protein [Acidobacteriota bacterium]
MITSMTGFAAATREDEQASVSVTIRAVNHRHLDVQFRMPQSLTALEGELRAIVGGVAVRGRLDVSVSVQSRLTPEVEVEFNEPFAKALGVALEQARTQNLVSGALTPGDLLRFPQALSIREKATDDSMASAIGGLVKAAVDAAAQDLRTMRSTEGEHLRRDLDDRRTLVADLVERIAVAADEGRVALEQRLTERVAQIRADVSADETAVAQEIVKWAARSDISEEVARFRAHVSHWQTLADSPEPCGRKLDFLLQEMNREVNTMGSKADGLRVSELVIGAKAELEKMREQVQNVE